MSFETKTSLVMDLLKGEMISTREEPLNPSDNVFLLYSESTYFHLGRRYLREFRTALRVLRSLGLKVKVVKEHRITSMPMGDGVLIAIDNRCISAVTKSYIEDHLRRGGGFIAMYQTGNYYSNYVKSQPYLFKKVLGLHSIYFLSKDERYNEMKLDLNYPLFYRFASKYLPSVIDLGRGYGVQVNLGGAQAVGFWKDGSPAITVGSSGKVFFIAENLLAYENAYNPDVLKLIVVLLYHFRVITENQARDLLEKLSKERRHLLVLRDFTTPRVDLGRYLGSLDSEFKIRIRLNSINFLQPRSLIIAFERPMRVSGEKIELSSGWYEVTLKDKEMELYRLSGVGEERIWRGWRLTLTGPLSVVALGIPRGKAWKYWTYRVNSIYLRAKGDSLVLSIALPLEVYLAGVVPKEMPPSWPLEALKAQAVSARTYALKNLGRHRSDDLCDLPHCQAFGGELAETESSYKAVLDTKGEVITYSGDLIMAVYHSTCGGATTSAYSVWGVDIPYLRGVSDIDPETGEAYCESSPMYHWKRVFRLDELDKLIARNLKILKGRTTCGTFKGIDVLKRDESGRVVSVRLRTSCRVYYLRGDDIPYLFSKDGYFPGIPSTLITSLSLKGGSLVLEGRGWGHGVGMCQWGARGMALKGLSYEEILKHYYPGTELQSYKDLNKGKILYLEN